jgi:hypothetical protein
MNFQCSQSSSILPFATNEELRSAVIFIDSYDTIQEFIKEFNEDQWDVRNAKNMSSMFERARYFNGNIFSWDVSRVNDISNMFSEATSFNGDLSQWNVSAVFNVYRMFAGAK